MYCWSKLVGNGLAWLHYNRVFDVARVGAAQHSKGFWTQLFLLELILMNLIVLQQSNTDGTFQTTFSPHGLQDRGAA